MPETIEIWYKPAAGLLGQSTVKWRVILRVFIVVVFAWPVFSTKAVADGQIVGIAGCWQSLVYKVDAHENRQYILCFEEKKRFMVP